MIVKCGFWRARKSRVAWWAQIFEALYFKPCPRGPSGITVGKSIEMISLVLSTPFYQSWSRYRHVVEGSRKIFTFHEYFLLLQSSRGH